MIPVALIGPCSDRLTREEINSNKPLWTTDDMGLRQRKNKSKTDGEPQWAEDDSDVVPPSLCDSTTSFVSETDSVASDADAETNAKHSESFLAFRWQYLIVHIAIMLADGMQGKR